MKKLLLAILIFTFAMPVSAMYDPNTSVSSDEASNHIMITSANDDAPRIMYWYGKVNQHFDLEKKQWSTDPDGVSGANLDKLEYCQKFYPNTVEVKEYKKEETDNWKNRGNLSQFKSTKMSYLCVQGEETIDEDNNNVEETETDQALISYIKILPEKDQALVKWISREEDSSYISYSLAPNVSPSAARNIRNNVDNSNDSVACPMDVKSCPNGTWVSRVAPDCQFAPCPNEIIETIIVKDDNLTTHHSLVLENLQPGRVYHFQIHSYAGTDNEELSKEYRFRTLLDKPLAIDNQVYQIKESADLLSRGESDPILEELKQLRNRVREQEMEIKYLNNLNEDLKKVSDKMKTALNEFITYGADENTLKLGEGERAAVIHSYKQAFEKLPSNEEELEDAIKIANGRYPSLSNDKAETKAKEEFKKIYKREADLNNEKDKAAIVVMAYGLRQKAENRNLESEKQGINTFKHIYKRTPANTQDWNIMQAITYSGATR
jgi:hypothetical protein